MMTRQITAHFCSGEQVNAALADLERAGALHHTGSLPYAPGAGRPTLHCSVRRDNFSLASDIIRRSGGWM